jgi:hypothetical protein
MKKKFYFFLSLFVFAIYSYEYTNPVYNHNFADPFILSPLRIGKNNTEGNYYAYATNNGKGKFYFQIILIREIIQKKFDKRKNSGNVFS